MSAFPDLSALPIEAATDGLLSQVFAVRPSTPKRWEEGLAIPDRERELTDGSWARIWGSGPYILLVHGFEGRWSQWTPLAKALLAAGRSFVILEMPGHGRATGRAPNPFAFSRTITLAADTFGPLKGVVGHSQGASAALHAVSNGIRADRLVLLSPVVSIEGHLRRVCGLVKLSHEGTDVFLEKVEKLVGVPPSDFNAKKLARQVTIPTLIIHDDQDREAPFEDAQTLAESWGTATFKATSGLGHRRVLNNTEVVAAMHNFVEPEILAS